MINLQQGDCIELMKDIPDGSIDMILCDLPYGVTDSSSIEESLRQAQQLYFLLQNHLRANCVYRIVKSISTIGSGIRKKVAIFLI